MKYIREQERAKLSTTVCFGKDRKPNGPLELGLEREISRKSRRRTDIPDGRSSMSKAQK